MMVLYSVKHSDSVAYARGRFRGSKPPPIDDWKKLQTVLFGPISVFHAEIRFFCAVSNCLCNLEKLSLWCNITGSQTFLVYSAWTNGWLKMQAWTRSMGTKAGVVLWCHKDIVLNGYGWTRQRFRAEDIVGREWLQRRQIFRLRCHDFDFWAKPTSWRRG